MYNGEKHAENIRIFLDIANGTWRAGRGCREKKGDPTSARGWGWVRWQDGRGALSGRDGPGRRWNRFIARFGHRRGGRRNWNGKRPPRHRFRTGLRHSGASPFSLVPFFFFIFQKARGKADGMPGGEAGGEGKRRTDVRRSDMGRGGARWLIDAGKASS